MRRSILIISLFIIASLTINAQNEEDQLKQVIVIETSYGNIEVLLYDETPLHRDNMIKLAKEEFYTNQLFHRVINDFMIQGGDPNSAGAAKGQQLGNGGPGYTIPAEINPKLYHKKGVIAAARMGDQVNPKRNSSGSQFYIVEGQVFSKEQLKQFQNNGAVFSKEQLESYTTVGGTPHLDGGYTVFGEVIKGMEIVEAISDVKTGPGDRPAEDIIFSIRLK